MIHKYGNLFDTDAPYIGHGVNTYGVMGAGIAKEFKERYPENFIKYELACQNGSLLPGMYMVNYDRDQKNSGRTSLVVNFASQDQPGRHARYSWVLKSFATWAERATSWGMLKTWRAHIAIPEIGCGIGGLEWPVVEDIIKAVEACYPVEFEVWHYEERK